MHTRRQFLAASLGAAGIAGLGGCLTRAGAAETGYLAYKAVEVGWVHRGQDVVADLCWAWSDGRSRVFGWVAEEYADLVTTGAVIRVTDDQLRRLEREFATVTFELAFARPESAGAELLTWDWYSARASRADFNRVQFGDRAAVVFRFPHVRVLDVHGRAQGDPDGWEHTVRPMAFGGGREGRPAVETPGWPVGDGHEGVWAPTSGERTAR